MDYRNLSHTAYISGNSLLCPVLDFKRLFPEIYAVWERFL
jgi:hypothetical protein